MHASCDRGDREFVAAGCCQIALPFLRVAIRAKHYSLRTEDTYVQWIRRFIVFHNKRHPQAMGAVEVQQFLTDLAVTHQVAASTQNQALSALVFLYKEVLHQDFGWLDDVVRAKKPTKLPVVLTRDEVKRIFQHLSGASWLIASLLYGAGLRLMECLRLRIKGCPTASTTGWRSISTR
jgi:site-specific recombinase XerD